MNFNQAIHTLSMNKTKGGNMLRRCLIAISLFFFVSGQAFAHDFWIEKKAGEFFVVSGHGDKWDPYDPARVKEVKAFDNNGKVMTVEVVKQKDIVSIVPKGDVSAITVFFDNYYWVKTTEGWKNITKREALKQSLQIVESGQSFKFSKYIEKWSDNFTKPLGMKFEVIPLKNPLILKHGDTLPVKVLLDGNPVVNASISVKGSHDETMKTDKNGLANVLIDKSGFNLISATTQVPFVNNPDADQLYLRATIAFEVK
jgi:nickel transport protein